MTNSPVTPSLGIMLEKELSAANVTLPPALRFVGCNIDKMPNGKIAISAMHSQSGVLVVAPDRVYNQDEVLKGFKAYRWSLNPFKIREDGSISRGSITLSRRVRLTCPTCKAQQHMWWSVWKHMERKLSQKGGIQCKVCERNGAHVELEAETLYTRLINDGNALCDGVFKNDEDPDILAMVTHFDQGVQPECATILPRIWATHQASQAPGNWIPVDNEAAELNTRLLKARGCVIRPIGMSLAAKATIKEVLISGSATLRTGWMDPVALEDSTHMGYTRRLAEHRKFDRRDRYEKSAI